MSNIIDKIQLSGVTYDIGGSGSVSTAITSGDTNAVAGGAVYDKFDEVEQVTAAALNELNDKVNPTVELTQAQYDALVTAGTVQQDTYYIITDATAVDMANYYTTAQTNSLLSGKQNTLVSGTNIKTINNESILGSGNISVEGKGVVGSGSISVSTGTTNYTINFTPSIWAGSAGNSIIENYSNNTASGNFSHAEGYNTKATGDYSHAEGYNTSASTNSAHAEGLGTKAYGIFSHAEGYNTSASGGYSHAEGGNTTASTDYAHAEGAFTKASGYSSHAEGYSTNATGSYSHAEGRHTTAQNEAEHASGRYNVSSKASTTFGDSGNTLFSVGNGEDSEYRHNALDIRQNGDIYIVDTSASGDYYDKPMIKLQESLGGTVSSAITRGDTNAVAGGAVYDKFDEVEQVTAQALNVLNESLSGKQDTLSAGTGIDITSNVISVTGSTGGKAIEGGRGISVTTGETADTISVSLSISAGTGTNSIKENNATSANGKYSHSEGFWTRANGLESHAEGYSTIASGESTHAEGSSTQANGISSHAEGASTNANGNYSHTEGNRTIANNQSEHASGQYNVSSSASTTFGDSGNTLFSVGNGTSSSARHNAFEIRQNGDIYCSDGTNDVKLQDTITATASNTTALGGLKLVKLTQSAYDNLQNKDSNTLYVIVN